DDDDRDEHSVDPDDVLVGGDEIPHPDQTNEELCHDHADESAADTEAYAGEDERYRRWDDEVSPQPALARVEGARDLEQGAVEIPYGLLRVDEDREHREQRHRGDPRRIGERAERAR